MEEASLEQSRGGAAGRPIYGSAIRLPAGGLLPFELETVHAALPHNPPKSATSFLTDLFLNLRAPLELLRATIKAVSILFAMRFGLSTRLIQEGFFR